MVNNKGKKRNPSGQTQSAASSTSDSASNSRNVGGRHRTRDNHQHQQNQHRDKESSSNLQISGCGDHPHVNNHAQSPQERKEREPHQNQQRPSGRANGVETTNGRQQTHAAQASASTQTMPFCQDTLLSFIEQSEWEKTEIMCEMVQVLGPLELRLLASVVENAARVHSSQFKNMDSRANSPYPCQMFPEPNPTAASIVANGCPPNQPSLMELLDALFMMVSLLQSSNRRSAVQLGVYIDNFIMKGRAYHLSRVPMKNDQLRAVEMMGRLASACLHHPAFPIDHRLRFSAARDELRCEMEKLCEELSMYPQSTMLPAVDVNEPTTTAPSPGAGRKKSSVPALNVAFVYIRRFKAERINENNFRIEMYWSDGQMTWTQRSREELKVLHHRLLDAFGEERWEFEQAALAAVEIKEQRDSSFESLSGASSTSTAIVIDDPSSRDERLSSKISASSEMFASRRILPYFAYDAPAEFIVQYINGLSDLPTRMMLSSVIYEEFHATRMMSNDYQAGGNRTTAAQTNKSPPVKRHTAPLTAALTSAITTAPLAYGPVPANRGLLQVINPSCSTCAEGHSFVHCPLQSAMESLSTFRMNYSEPAEPVTTDASSSLAHQQGVPLYYHPFPPPQQPPRNNQMRNYARRAESHASHPEDFSVPPPSTNSR